MSVDYESVTEGATNGASESGSLIDGVARAFEAQWWVFVVTLGVVLVVMIVVAIATRGKIFGIKTIIKVAINCVIGFVLLFMLNLFGGMFTGGAWSLVPKWYSWIIIGVLGVIGVIFLFITSFVWPGALVN